MKKIKLPSEVKQLIQKAAEKLKPQKMILFGSYAYGKPTPDSDVDLLVILDEKKRRLSLSQRYSLVSNAFYPRLVPFEFVVKTQKEIDQRRKEFDPFLMK